MLSIRTCHFTFLWRCIKNPCFFVSDAVLLLKRISSSDLSPIFINYLIFHARLKKVHVSHPLWEILKKSNQQLKIKSVFPLDLLHMLWLPLWGFLKEFLCFLCCCPVRDDVWYPRDRYLWNWLCLCWSAPSIFIARTCQPSWRFHFKRYVKPKHLTT